MNAAASPDPPERHLPEALALQYNYPFVDLTTLKLNPAALSVLPPEAARRLEALPIRQHALGGLLVAMCRVPKAAELAELQASAQGPVEIALASRTDLLLALDKAYPPRS